MDTPNYYSASDKFQSEWSHKELELLGSLRLQAVVVQQIFLSLLFVQGKHNQLTRNNQTFLSVIRERFWNTQATDNKICHKFTTLSLWAALRMFWYIFFIKEHFQLKLGFCVQLCSPWQLCLIWNTEWLHWTVFTLRWL